MQDQLHAMNEIEAMPVIEGMSPEDVTGVSLHWQGKVRDVLDLSDGRLAFVATDRISAFDEMLGVIPAKGEVNNRLSAWWMEQMTDIVPNHMVATPDANVTIGKKLHRVPVEVVVRGYITGVTDTSIWGSYERGERTIYGKPFREGYRKNDPLDEPIITPTTKADVGHDERLTEADLFAGNVEGVTPEQWQEIHDAALAMFTRAQAIAAEKGYILVDTKIEFGYDDDGVLYVIDELFTPDSSRFWDASTYAEFHEEGKEPANYDKEWLRIRLKALREQELWKPGDPIPHDLRMETAQRYISLFEGLTGETLVPSVVHPEARIAANLRRYVEAERSDENQQVVIIMGSPRDASHVAKITEFLDRFGVRVDTRVASAHKTGDHLLAMVKEYNEYKGQLVFITVAGGADGLSPTVDGHTRFPVLAAPPEGQSNTIFEANAQVPKGIASSIFPKPENAALGALKILAESNLGLAAKIDAYRRTLQEEIMAADDMLARPNSEAES